jgi:hypothetical protein
VARIHRETEKLSTLEAGSGNAAVLASLKGLVSLNEALKGQEATFKASCLAQRELLLQRMAKLTDASSSPEMARLVELEASHSAELAKLSRLRANLAQSNQAVARVQRAIDDVPTRAELLQFERRFVELYQLVNEKLSETKKFYALYNTLREVWEYTGNEKSLLESIIGQYPMASKTKQGKEQFVSNMEGVVGGVRRQSEAKTAELEREKKARDDLLKAHAALMEKQRSYFRAVKGFQEECLKNEKLTQLIEAQDGAGGGEGGGGEGGGGGGGKQANGDEEKRGGGED